MFKLSNVKISGLFSVNAPEKAIIGVRVWDKPNTNVPIVNPHYVFDEDLLKDLLVWHSGEPFKNMYLSGPTGSGKSTVIEQFAARMGIPVFRVSCNRRTEISEVFGNVMLTSQQEKSVLGKMGDLFSTLWSKVTSTEMEQIIEGVSKIFAPVRTEFVDGPALLANQQQGILLLDELDQLDVSQAVGLHTLLDRSDMQILQTGKTVKFSSGLRVAATGNSNGTGEGAELYRGVQKMNLAFLSRFFKVKVQYPEIDTETEILEKIAPKLGRRLLSSMVRFAEEIRRVHLHNGGVLDTIISTRDLINWAILTQKMQNRSSSAGMSPIELALERVVLNGASESDAQAIMAVWQRISPMGSSVVEEPAKAGE